MTIYILHCYVYNYSISETSSVRQKAASPHNNSYHPDISSDAPLDDEHFNSLSMQANLNESTSTLRPGQGDTSRSMDLGDIGVNTEADLLNQAQENIPPVYYIESDLTDGGQSGMWVNSEQAGYTQYPEYDRGDIQDDLEYLLRQDRLNEAELEYRMRQDKMVQEAERNSRNSRNKRILKKCCFLN